MCASELFVNCLPKQVFELVSVTRLSPESLPIATLSPGDGSAV